MFCIIHDAELTWCHAMNGVGGIDDVSPIANWLQHGFMELRSMTDLECYLSARHLPVDAMEVVDGEFLLIGRSRIVAMGDIEAIP